MSLRKLQKNPKAWIAAAVATGVVAVSVLVYNSYLASAKEDEEHTAEACEKNPDLPPALVRRATNTAKRYTNKSIALTLSHSILSSLLPLNDILLNSENVTFILPPNLSIDDLVYNVEKTASSPKTNSQTLPTTLTENYKLLKCLNLQGYFNIVKNIKPDMLLVCSDDLGISKRIPHDIHNFVKEIINIDQNKEDIYSKVAPIFIR